MGETIVSQETNLLRSGLVMMKTIGSYQDIVETAS